MAYVSRRWKAAIPLCVSGGLIAWLLWRVPLPTLAHALSLLDWAPLVGVTLGLVLAWFVWDSLCVWWLFADPDRPLTYATAMRARGSSYVFGVLHVGLGQGLLAWMLSKTQDRPLLAAAGRFMILAYVDVGVLLSLGFVGSALSDDPRTAVLAPILGAALAGLAAATLTAYLLPARWIERLKRTRRGAELVSANLPWRRIAPLYGLRCIHFTIGMTHAGTALWLCGIELDYRVVMSVIPLASLMEGLPISISGLGTRDALLLELLRPEQPATLLACTLVWWAFVFLGRAAIGLGSLWLPRAPTLLGAR